MNVPDDSQYTHDDMYVVIHVVYFLGVIFYAQEDEELKLEPECV